MRWSLRILNLLKQNINVFIKVKAERAFYKNSLKRLLIKM